MHTSLDVETGGQSSVIFHLTGRRQGAGLDAVDALAVQPPLLAAYRDLTQLRYDFPLVLVADGAQGGSVQSLSRIVDQLLQRIAPPGMTSERLRRLVLRLEREIRTLAAQGATGPLSALWDRAADFLREPAEPTLGNTVKVARAALEVDGEVVDCDATTASRLLDHLWNAVQEDKARNFRANAGRLAVKLDDILRADFARSELGRGADRLSAGIGSPHRALFDFAAMSRLLPKSSAREALPASRLRRIEWALAVLTGQRFFAAPAGHAPARTTPYSFKFDSCAEALAAYRERLPLMVELVKALSVAELEVDGAYVESRHDAYFADFDATSLGQRDLALFPDYLVTLGDRARADTSGLLEALSSGVPLKVLVNIHDLHEDMPGRDPPALHGLPVAHLTSMAIGLDGVFVMQSASSNLYRMRERIRRGLGYAGPALFCVFSGATGYHGTLPAYLRAAAAAESRAFPAFTFDPGGGGDLASRFSLEGNPQPDRDWPMHRFAYADAQLGRVVQDGAFTLLDFLATERRNARHFARVAPAQWNERMLPAAQLTVGAQSQGDAVPFVLAVDSDGLLYRLIVDETMMMAARRCLDTWHRLQELGGVHNSHAERLLAREKAEWEKQKQAELAAQPKAQVNAVAAPSPPTVPAAAGAPVVAPVEAAEPERVPDEPYVETARCSSCNECILINDRMFAYNENKQAFIADPGAGTFRQLVEAAESCQLSIIHPGKPRDPGESGLDELMERAQPFA